MPLFNRRNKAGSGAGEQIHIGHNDPFMGGWSGNPTYASKDPFAPKASKGGVSLERAAGMAKTGDAERAKQGKFRPDPFA